MSSTLGSSTVTGEKRRASAESRSILRYSASVVAPITRSSPRASIGLRMFAASMPPSGAPAPSSVCSSSRNRIRPSDSAASASASLKRFSNWPRNWAPAIMPDRSSAKIRVPFSVSGTSSRWMRRARPSAMAVLPTPASPIRTALFLRRRARISTVCSISSARPMTGSMRPLAASAVRSRPNSSSADSGCSSGPGFSTSSAHCFAQQRHAPVGAGGEHHPHRARPLTARLAGLGVENLSHGH